MRITQGLWIGIAVGGSAIGGCSDDSTLFGGAPTGIGGGTSSGTITGGGGSIGGGGSGGSGGDPVACASPTDCPGEDNDCQQRTCEGNLCGLDVSPSGTPCADDGGTLCDGAGHCVKDLGDPCDEPEECLSGQCADGVCCDSACDGMCEACDVANLEGTCTAYDPATDPDDECADGVCDGVGACASGEPLWSRRFGDGSVEYVLDVAVDSGGNSVVIGYFWGSIDFGNLTLDSAGGWDVFVAKYDPDGTLLWAHNYGDDADWDGTGQFGSGIAVDSSDNVVITGYFYGSIDFGGGWLDSLGYRDVFLAKLSPAGDHLWSDRYGDATPNTGSDWSYSVDVAPTDHIVIAGSFRQNLDIGGTVLSTSGNDVDVFVARFAADGTPIAAADFGDGSNQEAMRVKVDSAGNLVLAGYFYGNLNFAGNPLGPASNADGFVAKLDTDLGHLWSLGFGDGLDQLGRNIAFDAADNVVLSGHFQGSVDLGGASLGPADGWDLFIAKLSSTGTHIWSQSFGGAANDLTYGVAVDGSDHVVAVGLFSNAIDFGGGELSSAGATDLFVAKLTADGTHLWSQRFGDGSPQYGRGVAIDSTGHILAAGYFEGTLDLGAPALVTAGQADGFLAKLAP